MRVEEVFIPPVVTVINAARQRQPEAESVRVYVCTHGDQWECVQYPLIANWDSRLEWYRRSRTAPSNDEMQLTSGGSGARVARATSLSAACS
jgi:hypothetical protein